MSKASYRVKKCRALKRRKVEFSTSDVYDVNSASSSEHSKYSDSESEKCNKVCEIFYEQEIITNVCEDYEIQQYSEEAVEFLDSEVSVNDASDSCSDISTSNHLSDINFINDVVESNDTKNFYSRLRSWALKHINTLTNNTLTDLLIQLRREGYTQFPKTAETFLGTKRDVSVQVMTSQKGSSCLYTYLGIENCLRTRISRNIYKEDSIRVLVNIDGASPYKQTSKQHIWPILIQVFSTKYFCKPSVVAIYCGDSKPKCVNEYLRDFVEESNSLIENGITIENVKYRFEIAAFVCDTPARTFIKCCKGHGGFFACERCEVKGVTINGKRVYCDIESTPRTNESYREQRQPEHHLPYYTSPLLELKNFDPVKSILLDNMHMLFLGNMKLLLEKWLSSNNVGRIGAENKLQLKALLETMPSNIPDEFQRKELEFGEILKWKATQYRFILLYCGPIIFREVLSDNKYLHFLLLSTACRLLSSKELAVTHADYANKLLRKYVYLMPSLYGKDSQVLNNHNLIHLAEDVKQMQASLSFISAFPFENCLGKLKKFVRSPKNPMIQIVKRLSESELHEKNLIKSYASINVQEDYKDGVYVVYRQINVKNIMLSKTTEQHRADEK